MRSFEVLLWPVLMFIVLVASLPKFTAMAKILKVTTDFAAVTATGYFSSFMLTKPVNLVLKNRLPIWLSTALGFEIPRER